jgi:hypothetical protein
MSSSNPEDLALGRMKVWRSSLSAFCHDVVKIQGQDEAKNIVPVPFILWPSQCEVAEVIQEPGSRLYMLKSRQTGMTWLSLANMIRLAVLHSGLDLRIVSIGERESFENLDRAKWMYSNLPAPFNTMAPDTFRQDRILVPYTKSKITALPSTGDVGSGLTVDGWLLDEFAKQENTDAMLRAILPTLEHRNAFCHIISSAKGYGNSFEQGYHRVEAHPEGNWRTVFLPWSAVPARTPEWREEQRRVHGDDYVAQEFPSYPGEAFLSSGRNFFATDKISAAMEKAEDGTRGYVVSGQHFVADHQGNTVVWKGPVPRHRYVVGGDVAEGLAHGDKSVLQVLDISGEHAEQVAELVTSSDPEEFAHQAFEMATFYNKALLAVEANNHGWATILVLRKLEYPNLFMRKNLESGDVGERAGWLTTSVTRKAMLAEMQGAFRKGEVVIRSRGLLEEMRSFIYRPNGVPAGERNCLDDRVLSFAIALICANQQLYGQEEAPRPMHEILSEQFGYQIKPSGIEWAVKYHEAAAANAVSVSEDDLW